MTDASIYVPLVTPLVDKFMVNCPQKLSSSTDRCDNILGCLMDEHSPYSKDIRAHLIECIAYSLTLKGKTHDLVGPMFHKGFRQYEPIDRAPLINTVVWLAISGSHSFWTYLGDLNGEVDTLSPKDSA